MNRVFFLSIFIFFFGCQPKQQNAISLQAKADSLQSELDFIKQNYKPGLGEMMLILQQYHNRLWSAGIRKNWLLTQYEMDEIKELLEKATTLHDNDEKLTIPMNQAISSYILPPLTNIYISIAARSKDDFVTAFDSLTLACNRCHQANNHPFINVERPGAAFSGDLE